MAALIKKSVGKPSKYTPEIAQRILDIIKTQDLSLKEICDSSPDFPTPTTVYSWVAHHKEFGDDYIIAKRKQVQVYIDNSFDEMKQTFTNPLDFQMYKLKIEHIRWYASKLMPRLYGSVTPETEDKIKSEVQALLHDAMAKACKAKERDY